MRLHVLQVDPDRTTAVVQNVALVKITMSGAVEMQVVDNANEFRAEKTLE